MSNYNDVIHWHDVNVKMPPKTNDYIVRYNVGNYISISVAPYSYRHKMFNCRDWYDTPKAKRLGLNERITHWAYLTDLKKEN